ncbi:MAG: transglutaminase-like domain-containing protein [Candidatus Bathyarchaeia archaeon]|jgi:predicted transglutaminase-like protease
MNIKQTLRMIYRVLTSAIGHFFKGYWPTSDEIGNDKVMSLASRLKAESYKETLTNILEWQERNIVFWTERHPVLSLLGYIWLIFGATAVVFSVVSVSILLLIVLNSQTVVLVWLIQIVVWSIQNVWLFIAILASSNMTILATMISILRSNRKFPWKEVPRGLKNVFFPSISMNFLLEKRLGVCRDYAKLTSCLLSNIYPHAEIYFASAPGHVATGIIIENRLYMLDQRLPILTKDRWNDYRKPKKSDTMERFDLIKNTLQKARRTFPQTSHKPELNTEKLARLSERMTELLNIEVQPHDKTISRQKPIPIPWKNGAKLYEENEMTDYSLARFLATEISSELVKISQITKIETSCNKDDLIFQIHISKNE